MNGRRALSPVFGALLAGAMVLSAPVAASASQASANVAAYEWNTATKGSVPANLPCIVHAGATACFEAYGDRLWVKDTAGDGHSATGSWEDWYKSSSGRPVERRQGSCVNKLGAGTWGFCNKDFTESDIIYLSACVYDSADGTWHGCSAKGWVNA